MSVDGDLLQPDRVTEPPPAVEDPPAPPVDAPLSVEDDAAVDAALAEATVKLPDGDSLVSGQKAGDIARSYRGKIKDLKAELDNVRTTASRATQLEADIAALQQQVQQLAPYAQAYQVALQQQQPQAPQDTPEDRAELEEIARDFDLYKPDGSLDVEKARRQQQREERRAQRIAQREIAPLQQTAVQRDAATMLAKAKAISMPNGAKPDPAMLDRVWAALDPSLTATVKGAQQAYMIALGYSQGQAPAAPAAPAAPQRAANGQFATQEPLGAPQFVERAGGRDTPPEVALSAAEQRYLKDTGMTEQEYRTSAKSAPWLRR